MLRLTLRNLFARKLRLLMSGLAIVLGVGFLSGVLVFSNGLSTTFDRIINGSTPDGLVRAEGGESFSGGALGTATATLAPGDVEALAALPEVERADGGVDGFGMSLLASDGSLVGGTGAPTLAFNRNEAPNMAGEPILELTQGAWPDSSTEVVLDDASADRGGYALGDQVRLIAPYGELERAATLVGTAELNGGGTAGATLLVFDTEGAQELFLDGQDRYTSVSLTAAEGVSQQELVDAAERVVPDGFVAVSGDDVVEESEDAIGAFLDVISTFLLVFAVIAVVVGGFIIVNTFTILVAQRTRELALLRALGASRGQVTRSVLVEAAALALLASTVGILLGWALARGLAAVFRAVGLDIAGGALTLTPGAVLTSYAAGLLVTLVAAYLPARRAGRVAPVAAMRVDQVIHKGSLRRRTLYGAIALAVGAGFVAAGLAGAPNGTLLIGIGAVLWILTVAAISSVVGRPVLIACRAAFGRLFGTTGRLAGENALRDPRRTGATASALMIGLALVSTIGVLAASLNTSVDDLVDEEFTADYLVQSTAFMPFSTEIGDRMEQVEGVETLSRQQWAGATLDGDLVVVSGNDDAFTDVYDLDVLEGDPELGQNGALVFEETASRHGWHPGDSFRLSFPGGAVAEVTVAAVIAENPSTSDISVPLALLTREGLTRQDSTLSILVEDGADRASVEADLEDAVGAAPVVGVFDKESFAEQIRGQVNQLLYMIYGLLALAIVIAVIGIVNTLGLSVIERTREIGLLRAVGLDRPSLRRMVTLESVAIAVLGAVLGLVLGVAIGTILRQQLREDLTSLAIPMGQLAAFLVIAVIVGVLAAVIPAIRAARLNVLEAIAEE
ncbi:ABC transporter permease [Nocardioides insulae]|uniref:ABC transporter permease n=1 Tax=Nocardioides insulae TaxID=394734 RepID=UPI0003F7E1F6|nr:FtsX-like permease family protein [Nocardioides insulae]